MKKINAKNETRANDYGFINADETNRVSNRRMIWLNHIITGNYDKEGLKNYLKTHNNQFPYRTEDSWLNFGRCLKSNAKPVMKFLMWECVDADKNEYRKVMTKFYAEEDTKIFKNHEPKKLKAVKDKGTTENAEKKAKKYARSKAGMTIDTPSVVESVKRDRATDLAELEKELARITKQIKAYKKHEADIEKLKGIIARQDEAQQKRYARLAELLAK